MVSVRCGECTTGGGSGGGLGCLREMSVTALRTTVTITDTGELVKHSDLTTHAYQYCRVKLSFYTLTLRTANMTNIKAAMSRIFYGLHL